MNGAHRAEGFATRRNVRKSIANTAHLASADLDGCLLGRYSS